MLSRLSSLLSTVRRMTMQITGSLQVDGESIPVQGSEEEK